MPAVFGRLPSWSFGVLVSHSRFERLVAQKADSRRKLYNGQIECWFYHYQGPLADSPIEPVFRSDDDRALRRYRQPSAAADSAASRQQEMFANRLVNRARHLRRWPQRGITCYRIYDRDMPEIPLVIDRYEGCLHIVELPRQHDRTLSEHHRWLDALTATAAESLGVSPANVFFKRYADRREPLATAVTASPTHVVQEAGMKYHVNLRDYIDTGLRLDLRTLRGMIRPLAAGRRLLSLNGNSGGMAVAAAAGGAASTVTIDVLEAHVHWTRENLLLNGFAEPAHQAICGSPGEYLQGAVASLADIITIEEPTTVDLGVALKHLAPEGIAFLISSDRRYRPDRKDGIDFQVREITQQTLPEDFRNRRVHRVWRARV
jgi:23S rRNA (guanine2445-N2)-methyltransferase / 23S rRNA (guanine2069-N7)-methyltransferase